MVIKKKESIVPEAFSRWLSIGEKSGKGSSVFLELKEYFETRLFNLILRISSLIEPALIMAAGSFILLIVIKIVLPLFSMYGTVFQ